jgi:condensin-2 complex subunit G2
MGLFLNVVCFLEDIVLEHASDASSSAVRAAALDATTTLLEIPQSHAVLRALLPSLGNLIHDKVEKVRVSCVRMLQKIKAVPGIRFYHVVPVDHLTARLSEEVRIHSSPRNAVAKEISALMLNSYFPQGPNVSGADQLKRTLTFLMTEPAAAAVFYANLADFLEVDSVTKFITILLMCLRSAVQTDQAKQVRKSAPGKKRRRRGGAEEEEDQAPESQEQKMSAANTPLMASLVETISVLWESIESQLKNAENESSHDLLLESFMNADCVSILSHFEQKTADIEGNSDEEAIARDDCFRTCAAILRCASRLPRDTIDELVPHISSTLSSISNDDMDYSRQHISAHFALLCLWGMTDEVASSLSSSIEAAFGDDMDLASSMFDEDSAQKTRRRSSIGQPLVPIMSSRLVWGVIENILQGSDPSSVTTRESILASPTACNAIETALEHGTSYAERILQSDGLGRSFRESEVEFVLSACEAYGRFALHKEAQTGDGVSLSSQAKMLLNWTTEKLIPVFKKAEPGEMELRDLDLSRISNADSLIIPESPALMSPPRRKADLKNTPNRMEDDSAMFDSNGTLKEPTIFLVSAVAGALLQSSCVIFSEWLAVGGSGADEISRAAVRWCRVFQSEDEEEDPNEHHRKELMPAFVRLAVQLCKSSEDPLLLKQLLVNCSEEAVKDDAAVMKKAILSLCTAPSNQQSKVQGSLIKAFLGAAHELLDTVAVDVPFDLPDAVDEVWSHDRGCVASSLSVIMCNRQACSTLARQLVSDLSSHVGEPTKKSTFEAKCLSFLLSSSEYDAEISKIIRDLDAGKFEEGGQMRNVVDKLLESAA